MACTVQERQPITTNKPASDPLTCPCAPGLKKRCGLATRTLIYSSAVYRHTATSKSSARDSSRCL